MRKVILGLILLISAFALTSSAHADPYIDGYTWDKGCVATYNMTPNVVNDYPELDLVLHQLHISTGITFVKVDLGADINYVESETPLKLGDKIVEAYYDVNDTVYLSSPRVQVKNYGRTLKHWKRYGVLMHESLHWLGLSHNPTKGSAMNAVGTIDYKTIPAVDLYNVQKIARDNNCL